MRSEVLSAVKKIQAYLRDDQQQAIAQVARKIGRSKSEVIRRAIDAYCSLERPKDLSSFLNAIEKTSDAWKDWTETGAEYVDRIRDSHAVFERIEGRKPTRLRRKAADLIHEERSLRDDESQDG